MKQHIKVEQLNELSDGKKEALRKWWNKKIIERTVIVSRINTEHIRPEGKVYIDIHGWELPILSIGQMIEFLDEHNKEEINLESGPYKHGVDTYIIGDYKFKDNCLIGWDGELCDALWEAVKQILNAATS